MATILPFRGVRYNPDKIKNMANVVSPPYDVISEQEQQCLYDRHPNNIIRLILGRTSDADIDTNNRHTRSASDFNTWLRQGILIKDPSPVFYLTAMDFETGDMSATRFGLIALVKLEPFDSGIILPHEKTFSRVKSERLELIKACNANFSQVFSLYSDQNQILSTMKSSVCTSPAVVDLTDESYHRHRLWKITDPDAQQFISEAMNDKSLFIADGHHRYETALNYRNWLSETNPDFNENHPANYVMMYLSSMEDSGLVILPTHRMLKQIPDSALTLFIQKAAEYFEIKSIPINRENIKKTRENLISQLRSDSLAPTLGVCIKNQPEYHLMTLKPNIMQKLFANELPPSLMSLDVTVLTRLVFMKILNFDQNGLDNERLFSYSSSHNEAIDEVLSGHCDMSFILNPTRISQVRQIAEERLTMPRKSTYFYPKALTGLVINHLQAE
ncbi:MAG: DUF1015 domain-containing protein [Desulfobacterales bacterium]|nr:DUF1015 domain-containing protein [Desulfobacterales bacterium]MDD4391650.1 DUF1015 domain-containing protein [Desulfobacterales bacterium]